MTLRIVTTRALGLAVALSVGITSAPLAQGTDTTGMRVTKEQGRTSGTATTTTSTTTSTGAIAPSSDTLRGRASVGAQGNANAGQTGAAAGGQVSTSGSVSTGSDTLRAGANANVGGQASTSGAAGQAGVSDTMSTTGRTSISGQTSTTGQADTTTRTNQSGQYNPPSPSRDTTAGASADTSTGATGGVSTSTSSSPSTNTGATTTTSATTTDTTGMTSSVVLGPRLRGGFYIGVAGGASFPMGTFNDFYNTGWNVSVPIGWQSMDTPWGARVDLTYNQMSGATVGSTFGSIPVSDAKIWSGMLDVTFGIPMGSNGSAFYLMGGGGVHHFTDFGQTSSGALTSFAAADNGNSMTKFGLNGGAGVSFPIGPTSLFLEGRWVTVFTPNERTNYVPVTLGIRFF